MKNASGPLAEFGLDAIDIRWTMKDIASKRWHMTLKEAHLSKLIEFWLVEIATTDQLSRLPARMPFGITDAARRHCIRVISRPKGAFW
jgi:hypothetical protein